jgi:hypothetical protein
MNADKLYALLSCERSEAIFAGNAGQLPEKPCPAQISYLRQDMGRTTQQETYFPPTTCAPARLMP